MSPGSSRSRDFERRLGRAVDLNAGGGARTQGLQLTGEGGLLHKLTKRVLESALEGEITDHVRGFAVIMTELGGDCLLDWISTVENDSDEALCWVAVCYVGGHIHSRLAVFLTPSRLVVAIESSIIILQNTLPSQRKNVGSN